MALRDLTDTRTPGSSSSPSTEEEREAAAVALSNVTRVFGSSPGIVRVDLSIAPGETVLLRGPNGAGKTTLLRVIATAISPTYGSGAVFGFDLVREREAIRRRTELLGHRTRLYEDLSPVENLRFTCRMFGIDTARVAAALERVGLHDVRDERVRGFSQGMRQRVAFARALVRAPELLLLDEPYSGLDEDAKDLVDEVVRETTATGGTVVLATHDASRGAYASRTLHMESGRLR